MKRLFLLVALVVATVSSMTPAKAQTCLEQCIATRQLCLNHCHGSIACWTICGEGFAECRAAC